MLAGQSLPQARPAPGELPAPAWSGCLLEALAPSPAYLLGPRWEYLAWNSAQSKLFPEISALDGMERNFVWVMFALPSVRALIIDWEDDARRVLSQFRADTAPIRDDPSVTELVARLRSRSREFEQWWERHDVAEFQTRVRRFAHPCAGVLTFEYQQLVVAGAPDLRVVVQLPVDGDDSAQRLAAC